MRSHLSKIQGWEALALEAKFHPAIMAALCPICPSQMERFLRAEFQKIPMEWIREFRCRLARQLISQGWSNKAVEGWLAKGDCALTVFAPSPVGMTRDTFFDFQQHRCKPLQNSLPKFDRFLKDRQI